MAELGNELRSLVQCFNPQATNVKCPQYTPKYNKAYSKQYHTALCWKSEYTGFIPSSAIGLLCDLGLMIL